EQQILERAQTDSIKSALLPKDKVNCPHQVRSFLELESPMSARTANQARRTVGAIELQAGIRRLGEFEYQEHFARPFGMSLADEHPRGFVIEETGDVLAGLDERPEGAFNL